MRVTLALYLLAALVSFSQPSLKLPAVLPLPPSTNTVGIHAVWDAAPFADSYDLAWGLNGIYANTTNVSTLGAIFRWPATNPLPSIVVRTRSQGQVSDWSAPFGPTNYGIVTDYASPDLKTWTPLRSYVVSEDNATGFYRMSIQNLGPTNYPTTP